MTAEVNRWLPLSFEHGSRYISEHTCWAEGGQVEGEGEEGRGRKTEGDEGMEVERGERKWEMGR